jgi:hypothetical protein
MEPMPTQTISTKSAEHYKWGGPQGTACDGWHLVRTPELSIIEELMPPGATEARHSHVHAPVLLRPRRRTNDGGRPPHLRPPPRRRPRDLPRPKASSHQPKHSPCTLPRHQPTPKPRRQDHGVETRNESGWPILCSLIVQSHRKGWVIREATRFLSHPPTTTTYSSPQSTHPQ